MAFRIIPERSLMNSRNSINPPLLDSGEERVARAFGKALQAKSAALMPYFTLGYPSRELTLSIVKAIAPFSDLIELGIPFSDPIADGPTIQQSSQHALEMGTTAVSCLTMLSDLRKQGMEIPVLLMSYYNSILAYGEDKFASDAAIAGADGLIVPDLPLEEAENLRGALSENGLTYIPFIAPTSSLHRIKMVQSHDSGFIYVVSVTGVTGARTEISEKLPVLVSSLRENTNLPIAVGFGISTPEQAAEVGSFADGVIVGSALISTVASATDKIAASVSFVQSLNAALSIR